MKQQADGLGSLKDELMPKDDENLCITERDTKISMDDMLQTWTGEFGRWQLRHFVLSSLAWTLEALHTMVMIFADHQPDWHCRKDMNPTQNLPSMKHGFESCTEKGSICSMDKASWEWEGGRGVSTVSTWGLICDQEYKVGVVQSAFFIGCMLGAGIFGQLSDSSLGRKGVLRLVCICNAILGFLTALSPNFWVYLILRLLTGTSTGGVGLSSFVLATEPVGPSKRGTAGMSTFYFFSFGIAVLPALAYFSRNWRYLYVASSIPSALYCLFVLPFVSESPRWYLVKGRLEEAMDVMRSMAAKNGKSLPAGVSLALESDEHDAAESAETSRSVVDVFRSPVTRTRMVLMAFIWLACGVGYYGLSLNVVNLSANLYLGVFLNGIAEVPAFALTAVTLDKFGRRAMLISTMLLSGVSSLLGSLASALLHVHGSNPSSTLAMPRWVSGRVSGFVSVAQVACGMVGIFGMAGSYNLIFIYTCELFPTVVRNAALGLACQAGQIGAVIAPLVVVVATVNPALPFAIIGVSGIVGGLLTIKLPETLNRLLYETMGALENAEPTVSI
eukprot:PITA_18340